MLEPVPWNEDKEYNDSDTYKNSDKQDHDGTLVHKSADVGFSDTGPVHERVFRKTR